MPTIYSPGQISAGTLNVAPINIGTQKSLEILNYSSYFLCLATTQAGATDKNDPSLVTVIEPWQGIRMPVPIGTANTQLYVGVDPTLSTNPVTFGNVVDLPGVQYQTFNVVVVPSRWALLGQSVVNPDGAIIGTSGLVTNDVTNPVNTQPVTGTPTASQYAGLSTTYQALLTVNAVCQKLMISTNNSSSTTALDSDTAYLIGISHNGGSTMDLQWTFNVGSIPPMPGSIVTAGPYYEIDLSPGVYVGAVYGLVNYITSGSEPSAVLGAII